MYYCSTYEFPILCKSAIEEFGTEQGACIGTGAYKYEDYGLGEFHLLKAYDGYWGAPAQIEYVKYCIVSNPDTAWLALLSGELDEFHGLSEIQIEEAKTNSALSLYDYENAAVAAMFFNTADTLFSDINARLAIYYLLDCDETALAAFRGDPASREGQRFLWQFAESLLPRKQAGQFNQALMELGSKVCVPRAPDCTECPVATLCEARRLGLQADIPPPKRRIPSTARREAAVLLRRRGRVLLLRCPEGGRWAGLWDFPRVPIESEQPADRLRELVDKVRSLTGAVIEPGELLHTIRHGVIRYRITLECYAARCLSMGDPPDGAELEWLRAEQLAHYPLSTTGRKLARWV